MRTRFGGVDDLNMSDEMDYSKGKYLAIADWLLSHRGTIQSTAGGQHLQEHTLQFPVGADTRTRQANTTTFPLAAIAHLDSDLESGTGFFISPTLLITAAHVIFDSGGQPVQNLTVTPGKNGTVEPFGEFPVIKTAFAPGWDTTPGSELDYAAIQVGTASSSFFNFAVFSNAQLTGLTYNLIGYPVDDPQRIGIVPGTMWAAVGQLGSPTPDMLIYTLDTSAGQSGSPIFTTGQDGTVTAVGIHVSDNVSGVSNKGIRINAAVAAVLSSWKINGL